MASRADRFDRADYQVGTPQAEPAPVAPMPEVAWPLPLNRILKVGDTVMKLRKKPGRAPQPHNGLDILAPAGTPVTAAMSGRVVRRRDGRVSAEKKKRAAGLWLDIEGKYLIRYLHLGSAQVREGDVVQVGQPLGVVAPPHTSGLAGAPHLHLEVRQVLPEGRGYGPPIDPLRILPPRVS